jgi:hypothetical protein
MATACSIGNVVTVSHTSSFFNFYVFAAPLFYQICQTGGEMSSFFKFLNICFHQYIGVADTVPPVYWCCAMQLHPLQRHNTEN